MHYWLHPEAEQDIADALDFYATHAGLSVARRFLGEFERVANLLLEHPGLGTPSTKSRRVFPLRVFPYSVVYQKWPGLFEQLFPKDKWSHSWVDVLGKAR